MVIQLHVKHEYHYSVYWCVECSILVNFQVYISQILVASALGSVVEAVGSVRVIPAVASGGSFLGFLTAFFLVIYPDVESSSSEQDQDLVGSSEDSEPNEERTSDQRLALLNLTDGNGLKETDNSSIAWALRCEVFLMVIFTKHKPQHIGIYKSVPFWKRKNGERGWEDLNRLSSWRDDSQKETFSVLGCTPCLVATSSLKQIYVFVIGCRKASLVTVI